MELMEKAVLQLQFTESESEYRESLTSNLPLLVLSS